MALLKTTDGRIAVSKYWPDGSRFLTIEEERRLVACVASVEATLGAYVALLGETGLRKAEGLTLRWEDVTARS